MPSKKRKDGTFRDIAHPLNSDMRTTIEKRILEEYESELKKMTEAAHKSMAELEHDTKHQGDE